MLAARRILFAAIVAPLFALAACTTPAPDDSTSPGTSILLVASQTLSLAESTATAALTIATTLRHAGTIGNMQLQQVLDADRAVDAAVRLGFAAVDVKDAAGALAAIQSPAVAHQIDTLQTFITHHQAGAP